MQNRRTSLVLASIAVFSLAVTIVIVPSYADTPAIPQWIKNNAKWWSEGAIGDSEYLKGIQYLVQQGIIQVQVPTTVVSATNGSPSDSDRVTSIVVRFTNLVNTPPSLGQQFTINSFQRIYEFGQTTTTYTYSGSASVPSAGKISPEFQLADLPSKDKVPFYQFIHAALDSISLASDQQPTADVNIDLYTGDGTLLSTLNYQKCNLNTYFVSTDSNKNDYRMASEDQAEFREFSNFVCQGYHLVLPNTSTTNQG